MTLVRRFVEDHPAHEAALFISGRENYFGTADERTQALGLSGKSFKTYTLNEFTTKQIQQYLSKVGMKGETIPDWLPSRPLLVGYLAIHGILQHGVDALSKMTRAEGWDYMLTQICEREAAQINDLGGEVGQVRAFIDRLATRARATSSGLGPIPAREIFELFRQIFPATPDEAAQQLLLRMAGLTVSAPPPVVTSAPDQEDGREFVDDDLVDAARAGDLVRFVKNNHDEDLNRLFSDPNCGNAMNDLGIEIAAMKLAPLSQGQASASLRMAAEVLDAPAAALDILRLMQNLRITADDHKLGDIVIRNGFFSDLDLEPDVDLSKVVLKECLITNLYVDKNAFVAGPRFLECQVEQVFGAVSRFDMPGHLFDDKTEIGTFKSDTDTNSEIRQQPLPPSVRVLLISLNKLFNQPGRGRKENAFPRGLDETERAYVSEVLGLLARYDFAHPQRISGPPVWIPNRSKRSDAIGILHAPQQSIHPLIVATRKI